MDLTLREGVTIFANFCLMAALIVYAFRWFAQYHTSGKWTKNITGLLAGIGFLLLAAAVLLTPQNAEVLVLIARTHAHLVFIVASNAFLIAAMAAFGIINYRKPSRLKKQRSIEDLLKKELPNIS
jgi:uncharacterized membrane protein